MTAAEWDREGSSALVAPRARGRWWASLVRTGDGVAPLILRATLALVFFPHGAQKALGWFGGYGLSGTLGYFTDVMHLPLPIALAIVAAELLGPLALAVGVVTRVAAAGIGAVMIGAIATTHVQHGFFMNWFGQQAGEGFEYHLLALGAVAALLVTGGGRASLDRRLAAKLEG